MYDSLESEQPLRPLAANTSCLDKISYSTYAHGISCDDFSGQLGRQAGLQSLRKREKEVQALQKALNLPETVPFLRTLPGSELHSDLYQSQNTKYNFYDLDLHVRNEPFDRNSPGYTGPLNSTLQNIHDNPSVREGIDFGHGQQYDTLEASSMGSSQYDLYDGIGRRALEGDRRNVLLGKIKNAHSIIQSQSEKLSFAENEIISFQGHIRNMEVRQKAYQEELESLRSEQQEHGRVKFEEAKQSHHLLTRIKNLEQEFHCLSTTHNALVLESKRRESVLDQTYVRLNAFEQHSKNLEQRNNQLMKEHSMVGQWKTEVDAAHQKLMQEKQMALGDTARVTQDCERVSLECSTLKSRNSELVKDLREQKSKVKQMEQDLSEIKMAREFESSRQSLLHEEVNHLQETCKSLRSDREQLVKDKLALERDVHKGEQETASMKLINELLKTETLRQEENRKFLEVELRTARKELQQCKTEVEREREKLMTEKHDVKEKLKTTKDNLERERRSLRDKLFDEKENFKNEIEQSKEMAKRLSEENKMLKKRCQEIESEVQSSRLSLSLSDVESYNGASAVPDASPDNRTVFSRKRLEELQQERSTYATTVEQLQSRLASLEEENRELKQEYEENKELLKLAETEKSILQKEKTSYSRLQEENKDLKEKIRVSWDQINALNDKAEQQTEAMKRLLDVSKNIRSPESEANILEESKPSDTESLTSEVPGKAVENESLREELESVQQQCQRLASDNRRLVSELDDTRRTKDQLERELADVTNNNETLSSQIERVKQEQNNRSVKNLQEELKHIRSILARLDAEKSELMSELDTLRQEKVQWCEEKTELLMEQAELEAENREMAEELQNAKQSATNVRKDESSNSLPSENKDENTSEASATADATTQVQNVKTELEKVWKMLKEKDDLLETQTHELVERQSQNGYFYPSHLQDNELTNKIIEFLMKGDKAMDNPSVKLSRLADEGTQMKKDFAEMATKTSSRNQMISILRDQLMDKTNENADLQQELLTANEQVEMIKTKYDKLQNDLSTSSTGVAKWIDDERSTLQAERDLLKVKNVELECKLKENLTKDLNITDQGDTRVSHLDLSVRRRSDTSLVRLGGNHLGSVSKDFEDELRRLKVQNGRLQSRLDELFIERDSALQDSQDLREGMQQLKEAFEDEIERELEMQRERFDEETRENEKGEERNSLDDEVSSDLRDLQNDLELIREEKDAIETKRKNLEFERDELRKQIEELCENRARSEEKGIQVELSAPTPKRREQKLKKRSKSMGFITPIITVEEVNGSPQSPPLCSSPRRRGSVDMVEYTPPSPQSP